MIEATNIAPIYEEKVNPEFYMKSEIIWPRPIATNNRYALLVKFLNYKILWVSSL